MLTQKIFILMIAGLVAAAGLLGCEKLNPSPGTQCLDSFKANLKDPESGKAISFEDGVLTYTATNSYGARTQGKAICEQGSDKKWTRSFYKEKLLVLDTMTAKIEASNKCRLGGKSASECGANRTTNLDLFEKEVARELGF